MADILLMAKGHGLHHLPEHDANQFVVLGDVQSSAPNQQLGSLNQFKDTVASVFFDQTVVPLAVTSYTP